MKRNIKISPVGLKGAQINERMKELMGISSINESKSNIVVELTKMGPDGKAYAIVRENHEWYIKSTAKTSGLVAEDFKYIGGLQNKKSEAYPSYAKAIKHLNLKFRNLAEAYNFEGEINVFENDNLLSEVNQKVMDKFEDEYGDKKGKDVYYATANKQDRSPETFKEKVEEDVELTEEEKAIMAMTEEEEKIEEYGDEHEISTKDAVEKMDVKEGKLSILAAMEKMDAIIDSLTEGRVKKKVYKLK